MIRFSTVDLMDEQKCYDYLVEVLHPDGLCCPECKTPVEQSKVHRRDRAPLLSSRCSCGRIYNAFAGTLWKGTRHRCCVWVFRPKSTTDSAANRPLIPAQIVH